MPAIALMENNADRNPRGHTFELLHEDYPPYVYVKDGEVVGSIAQMAAEILAQAGYEVQWRKTNYRRLLRELQLSVKPLCAAGYSQSHQQSYEVIASAPFSRFPGTALAIRKPDAGLFSAHTSIFDVMNDENLRGAFLMGANYRGISADVRAGQVERHILLGSTDIELGLLLARGRVHFALLNPDQTNYLVENIDLAKNLMVFQPSDMAPPRDVGFICSKATAGDALGRLNASITALALFDVRAK